MIAFGTAITNQEAYERGALTGIAAVAGPDSPVMTRERMSLQQAYNEMLDEAAADRSFPHS